MLSMHPITHPDAHAPLTQVREHGPRVPTVQNDVFTGHMLLRLGPRSLGGAADRRADYRLIAILSSTLVTPGAAQAARWASILSA